MKNKIIALRIEEKKAKKIEDFCEKNEIKQSKLINALIDNFFSIQETITK